MVTSDRDPGRGFCAGHQIAVEAWPPLGRGNVLDDPEIIAIARRAAKSPAQMVPRWHLQRGDIVSTDEVEVISALNRDERTGPAPGTLDVI